MSEMFSFLSQVILGLRLTGGTTPTATTLAKMALGEEALTKALGGAETTVQMVIERRRVTKALGQTGAQGKQTERAQMDYARGKRKAALPVVGLRDICLWNACLNT